MLLAAFKGVRQASVDEEFLLSLQYRLCFLCSLGLGTDPRMVGALTVVHNARGYMEEALLGRSPREFVESRRPYLRIDWLVLGPQVSVICRHWSLIQFVASIFKLGHTRLEGAIKSLELCFFPLFQNFRRNFFLVSFNFEILLKSYF